MIFGNHDSGTGIGGTGRSAVAKGYAIHMVYHGLFGLWHRNRMQPDVCGVWENCVQRQLFWPGALWPRRFGALPDLELLFRRDLGQLANNTDRNSLSQCS